LNTISNEVCKLIFNTSLYKKRIVRIPDPTAVLTPSIVNSAAADFISANPFDETVGSLVSLANAERITTNRTILF